MNQSLKFFIAMVFSALLIKTSTSLVISNCFYPFRNRIGNYTVGCENQEGYHVDIFCHDHLSNNLPDLVKIRLPSVAGITFSNCTFSRTVNLPNIIHSINISYNQIDLLHYNTPNRFNFQNLSTPQLSLGQSSISELPSDLLYDVRNIGSLIVTETKLIRIPEAFFSDWAEHLLEVYLPGNKLRIIARNDFASLVNTVLLDISNNEIDEIESGAFDHLIHLDLLLLIGNRLHTLPSGIFQKLRSLTQVALPLPKLDEKSKNLDLAKNFTTFQHKTLLSNLFKDNAAKIKTIALEAPNVRSLPLGLFDDNKNLNFLNLDGNVLESLPVSIFKELKNLRYLQMSSNRLATLTPELFVGLNSIKCFSAHSNNLTEIDTRVFQYLKAAKNINLAYNQITKLKSVDRKEFQSEISFKNALFRNQQSLPLMEVNLTFNSFKEFNADFIDVLKYSESVYLCNNNISKINLTEISSQMAKLDRFKANSAATGYVEVYMGNNPIHCDCNLIDFVRYLNGSHYQDLQKYVMIFAGREYNFGEGFTGASPPELKNCDVRKVPLEKLYCPF